METVYDHNPTPEEIEYLGLNSPGEIEFCKDQDQDGHFSDIANLHAFRKDKKKVREYLSKIKDPEYRFMIEYDIFHFADESDRL